MNLLELVATLSLNSASYEKGLEQAHSDANTIGAKIGNAFKTMGKVALAGLSAAAAGVSALAKSSVEAYANYEQLVGGVDTLFKDSSKLVQEYAANAYKTAGLSANEYMETVTSFSASLLQSLEGDTDAAARVANRAITDMSDNANKMGTSMEMIQNAYNGFAKQNYTMLDNLKLGYGGTKEEMARLIEDASKLTDVQKELGITVDGTDMSFGNIVNAISVMQKKMDIAETTAKEAGTTISGSVGMMKSAWTNLVAEIAKPEGDIGLAINNLFTSIMGDGTDTNRGVIGNLIPIVEQTIIGIGSMVQQVAPIIAEQLPALVDSLLPPLLSAAITLINGLVDALPGILQAIIEVLPDIINTILSVLINNLPMLIEFGLQAIIALANGIAAALPTLIPQIVDVILTIVNTLINNIDTLIEASIAIMTALGDGLIEALPTLIEKIPEIVAQILKSLIKNAPKLLEAGAELLLKIWSGLLSGFGKLVQAGADIVAKVKEGLKEKIDAAKEWGHDLISNFIGGIKEKWNALKETVSGVGQKIKDFIGFSEPKEGPLSNFHTYAPDMMNLFIKGINDNKGKLATAVSDAFDFEDYMVKNPIGLATNNSNNSYSKEGERVYNYTVNVNQPVSTPDEMARVIRTESQYGLIVGEPL